MNVMTKEDLLGFFKPKIVERQVGEGKVFFRELSAPEVSDLREACKTPEKKADFGFHLVIASVVDADGKPVFSVDDLPMLRAGAQSRVGLVVEEVMKVNGFTIDKAAAEAAEKN